MACYLKGLKSWGQFTRDEEGHREYHPVFLVGCDATDGPANALACPGIPRPGQFWNTSGDADIWAWCHANATVKPSQTVGPNYQFEVEVVFTTRPPKRCMDLQITNPLLEPIKISGSFVKDKLEATQDRFGKPLTNTAWEQLRGPQVEFDYSRPTVKIEMNQPILNLPLLSALRDCVNDQPLWGLQARCVKLSNVTYERRYYGFCSVYYNIVLEFDINEETFDRDLLDEGTKVLSGRWGNTANGDANNYWIDVKVANDGSMPDPDNQNPAHFIAFTDRKGNPAKAVLDGAGRPFIDVMNKQPLCFYGSGDEADLAVIDLGADDVSSLPFQSEGDCYKQANPVQNWTDGDQNDYWWYITWTDHAGPGNIHVEKYPSVNLLLLGIPTQIGP